MKNVGLKEREGKTKWSHEFSLCAIGEGEHELSGWLQHSFYHHGSTFNGKEYKMRLSLVFNCSYRV